MQSTIKHDSTDEMSRKLYEKAQARNPGQFIFELPEDITEEMMQLCKMKNQDIRSVPALLWCENCKTKEKSKKEFKICLGCNSAYYCGKTCQKAHWPEHKAFC